MFFLVFCCDIFWYGGVCLLLGCVCLVCGVRLCSVLFVG